jgi:hypothetical protein
VVYALLLAWRICGVTYGAIEDDYIARATARDGYKRAMEVCQATRSLAESKGG